MPDHIHRWLWAGTRSVSGQPTVDVWRCGLCGETREEARPAMTRPSISQPLTPDQRGFLDEGWSIADAWTALVWLRRHRPDWFAELADVVEVSR